ncbi:hypothetical protein LXL04_007560 [Taraxacum kok-saghyz]
MLSIPSDVGFKSRKSGPEQTRILPVLTICRVLMLLSIHVETELAGERTEDHGTTSSQLRRSDRGSPRTDCIRCTQCECGLVWHGLSLAYDAGLRDLSWQS